LGRRDCDTITAVPSEQVSVTLGELYAPYNKGLPQALMREGMLRRVLSTFEIQDPLPDESLRVVKRFPGHRFVDRVSHAVWRRLPLLRRFSVPDRARVELTDRLWSRWIPACNIFHVWPALCVVSLQAARQRGAITLLENAGRHVRHWHESHVEESRRFGINARERNKGVAPWVIRRVERGYELCDRLTVPSTLAHRSLIEFGLGDKAIVVSPGVDASFFSPPLTKPERTLFRVCFVGRVELAKGVGYLLQAWKRLALQDAELVLLGQVKPEMNEMLRTHADSSVRVLGRVAPQELAQQYRESDLLVHPSVNEALAQVLLEAMASGLPIVATDYSGADDVITEGKEGFIVPVRDVDRLAEAISWCYSHRDDLRVMGHAARQRIESNFTLEHYHQRMIRLYRELAG
jgi:glycosyltransferase involved in cell wall biosynthesis